MADLHIDDFYRDVATIFLRLYAVFPRKTILYVEDICGPDQPDEFGLHHPRFEAGFSAMVWLAEQGYLDFQDTIRAEALDQAVLSRRGFLLLTITLGTRLCHTGRPRQPAAQRGRTVTDQYQPVARRAARELKYQVTAVRKLPAVTAARWRAVIL